MFIVTLLEKLLSERRSVLQTTQRGTGNERVKVSVKNQKNDRNLLILLETWMNYKLRGFWMFLKIFWFCLTLSLRENMKNSIFEMPTITQTLNINNLRTTSAKPINMHTIRKLVELSLKNIVEKTMFFVPF